MNQIDRVKILYGKYLDRTASPDEVEELFVLLRNRSGLEELHELFETEWDSDDVYFSAENMTWEQIQARSDLPVRVPPALAKKSIRRFWLTAAAAIVILLMGLAIWLWSSPEQQIYKTGFGETLEIALDDGSYILLNANSTLIWHSGWQKNGERIAELSGEAYFDVSHQILHNQLKSDSLKGSENPMPFRVVTTELTVNVLGTSFNILARRQKTDVFLKTGKILLTMNQNEDVTSKRHYEGISAREMDTTPDSIYMDPGDYMRFSGQSRIIDRAREQPSRDEPSWTEGFLTFENQQLNTVLQELEDIYGKTFVVQDTTLLKRIVNLGLPYEDWETVSGLMTLSLEIDMNQYGDQVTIRKKQGK